MQAVVCPKYGPPEVLQLREVEKPVPKDHEVLIKIHATTVTVADVRVRGFRVPLSFWLPARLMLGLTKPKNAILGVELAGEIEAVGKAVQRFKPGDQVFAAALREFGAYAEYKCLPETATIALKPTNATYAEAAALPIGARTALHYLRKANLQPGQKVLVYGASGSVGTYAVQLAKYFGAEVTGVCSSANVALVKALGADHVIDYTKEDFSANQAVYAVLLEAVDKSSFAACMRVLKANGIYMNVTTPLPGPQMVWAKLTSHKQIILGQNPAETAEDLNFIKTLVEAGKLKPVIDRSYPLAQIVEAHRYVDQGHKKGNVVVTVTERDKIML